MPCFDIARKIEKFTIAMATVLNIQCNLPYPIFFKHRSRFFKEQGIHNSLQLIIDIERSFPPKGTFSSSDSLYPWRYTYVPEHQV